MAKYFIQGKTLTSIADAVRNISGTTDNMAPDEMVETLNAESDNLNTNITAQDILINEIKIALAGKASGAGEYIDESKIILKSESGKELVSLNDVSEVPHNISVKVRTLNIFDASKLVIGGIVGATGNDNATNTRIRSDYCKVEPNTTYYIGSGSYALQGCHAYNKDKKWIKMVSITLGYIITPENTAFVRFGFKKSDDASFTNEELETFKQEQLWVSTAATAYTPYIEDFSSVTVSAMGKNLFDVNNTSVTTSNATYTQDGNNYTVTGNAGAYNGRSSGGLYITLPHKLKRLASKKDVVEYTVSLYVTLLEEGIHGPTFLAFCRDETNETATRGKNVEMQLGERVRVNFQLLNAGGSELKDLVFYLNNNKMLIELDTLQIEVGENVTEQEPYNGTTYPVSADGTAKTIKSISPNMTLIADGVHIDVAYHRSFGMQNEQDRFWDVYQEGGARSDYQFAFRTPCWTDDIYNPKYPIKGSGGSLSNMYTSCVLTDTKVPISVMDGTIVSNMFYGALYMKTIRELNVVETSSFNDTCFYNCSALENMTVSGTIGTNLNVQWSNKLTHDSLMSIIDALADKSADTSGTTWTVTIGATNKAKLTEEELTIASNKGWTVN